MTTLWLALGFIFFAVVTLGLIVWRLGRANDVSAAMPVWANRMPAEETYRPMARLFAEQDIEFLRSQGGRTPGIERRFRLYRRRVLSLYLYQLRGDFRQLWSFCRQLMPISKDPLLGSVVFRQFLIFYGLYTMLRLRCFLGAFVYVHADTGDLVSSMGKLEQEARRVLASLDPGLQPATALTAG